MQVVNFLSALAIPATIIIIIFYGIKEKVKIFDTFLDGAKEGMQIVVELFPTLLGIFLAIGLLRTSGVLEFIISIISPITNILNIPSQILPLWMLRPISGSASIGIAVDIMNNYGVDSLIGVIASTIMGATETTLYTIASVALSSITITYSLFIHPNIPFLFIVYILLFSFFSLICILNFLLL